MSWHEGRPKGEPNVQTNWTTTRIFKEPSQQEQQDAVTTRLADGPNPGRDKTQNSMKKPKATRQGPPENLAQCLGNARLRVEVTTAKISSQSHLLRQNGALLSMAQRPTDMQTDVIIFMAGHCETRHAKQAGTTKRG